MKYYLEFEEPIRLLDEEIHLKESILDPTSDTKKEIAQLHEERLKKINKIHSGLNRWQRVQLARHPQRPYSLDYIEDIFIDFVEIHGDRLYADDPAVVSGFAKIGKQKIAIVAQQKGRNTKENLHRNFGMMKPEGYRKAMRVMKIAEKFKLPVVTFMDTPGAFPGIGAEERGQGEAIANNLLEMSSLKVPIVSVVIGEGASGGALGIGLCDRFLMMQNTWYSVISPEGCASILFRDASKAEEAAEALKVTPDDMIEMGICDKIIAEPNGGAHRDMDSSAKNLELAILDAINELKSVEGESFIDLRIEKYDKLGVFETFK
ncbi:MAG: acetyl-CoA carboxylase carboxyl transferase subunit alpha [bacterium TMED217]|nr:MAG: acetyl-CoA carboxylase carboxyl transferase subunit alpha [bacterium TMED217]|tara:strand:- start:2427 stop:3383 length:957 start_codon:yes stop_codon:yes gene_type:complete